MGDNTSYCVGLLITLTVFLMHGCGVLPSHTSEPIHTYVLSADIPTPMQAERAGAGTLLVNLSGAQSGFNTQQMAYVEQAHELHYFAVNQWAETPARMLLPLLVKAVERTNQWEAVVQMPSPVRGDYQLISDNLVIQHEFTQQPSRIRIHLRLQLIRLQDFQVVTTGEFTALEDAKTDDPYGGVQAANVAAGKLLKDIADWLSLCMDDPKHKRCKAWSLNQSGDPVPR